MWVSILQSSLVPVDLKHKAMKAASNNIETDITIYGATSFTAKHVIIYLVQNSLSMQGNTIRITLAGRNPQKLKTLQTNFETKLKHLHTVYSLATNERGSCVLDTFVAECQDVTKLQAMAQRTKVVLNCAGPFAKYGSHVVAACAKTGTDYVDITGEISWAGKMRLQHGKAAQESGARIISFCGMDSIPSDLAVFAAVQALRNKLSRNQNAVVESATAWYSSMGFANGGTLQTMLEMPLNVSKTLWRRVPFLLDDPLILTHPRIQVDPEMETVRNRLAVSEWMNQLPAFHSIFRLGVSAPFLMAPCNTKVVNATAIALKYGPDFVYRERYLPLGFQMTTGVGTLSIIPAIITQIFTLLCLLILKTPKVGSFLVNFFMPPGSGSSDQVCQAGHVEVYAQVETKPNMTTGLVDRANCLIKFQGDPGNLVTAQCIAEAALALIYNKAQLPPRSEDGFGTPAELLGSVLLTRLQRSPVRPVQVHTHARKAVSGMEWRMFP